MFKKIIDDKNYCRKHNVLLSFFIFTWQRCREEALTSCIWYNQIIYKFLLIIILLELMMQKSEWLVLLSIFLLLLSKRAV